MSLTLFTLAVAVWQGVPLSLLYFVGASLLGVIYPLGTWAIAKRYPEANWLAWRYHRNHDFASVVGTILGA
jgi:hypothetical protein